MRDRGWKYWAIIAVLSAVVIFVLVNVFTFLMTVFFLDDKNVELTAPPAPLEVSSSSGVLPVTPTPPSTLPAGTMEEIDFSAYSPAFAERVGLTMGESRLDSIDKIRLYFAPTNGGKIISTASSTFERDDGAVMVFSKSGIEDDSVKAEEIYAVFSGPGGTDKFKQSLAAYGMRIKCHRGKNTTEWQTNLCP